MADWFLLHVSVDGGSRVRRRSRYCGRQIERIRAARRRSGARGHAPARAPLLTSAHLLFAVAQAEWDLFAQAMRDANVSPNAVLRSLDAHLCAECRLSRLARFVSVRPRSSCASWRFRVPPARAIRPSTPAICCLRCSNRRGACRRRSCDTTAPTLKRFVSRLEARSRARVAQRTSEEAL